MRVAVGGGVARVPHRQHARPQQGEGDEAVTLGGDVLLAAVLQQLHDGDFIFLLENLGYNVCLLLIHCGFHGYTMSWPT